MTAEPRFALRSFASFVTFMLLAMCLQLPSAAQVAGGTILGTVTDPSDAVIPRAHIAIRNVRTNEVVASETNKGGFFSVPNLLPGSYEVTASSPGFSQQTATDVTLTVGGQQLVNFKMNVGSAGEQVEVTGIGSAVEATSSTLSGVVVEQA